jgi:putative transposase
MQTISDLAPEHGVRPLCHALGIAPATYYRHRESLRDQHSETQSQECVQNSTTPAATRAIRSSPRALSATERERVLAVLHEPRFVDLAPAEIYATLLDEGTYLCSERTMYRLLAAEGEVRERRAQRRHPVYQAPELLATKPNQLWSWDITKLKGPAKWNYFNLYVVLDVFSRFVVGWMVAHRESATLAERLITTCCERQGILPGDLTIHADRGSAMTSKSVALLLADLGVTKTHSRPHVSNDNPYSESQFKTMKYRPGFPERFGSIQHARFHSEVFFDWYNLEHRHSGIGLLTPFDVHHGLAEERRANRAAVLRAAYDATPERFVRQLPVPPALPTAAWINPPKLLTLSTVSEDVAQ